MRTVLLLLQGICSKRTRAPAERLAFAPGEQHTRRCKPLQNPVFLSVIAADQSDADGSVWSRSIGARPRAMAMLLPPAPFQPDKRLLSLFDASPG